MSKKLGTYLIEYADGTSSIHGNNYKPWWQHAVEYIYSNYKNPEHGWRYADVAHVVKSVKFSNEPFFDDGGLKWASPKGYQEVIDEVAKKQGRVRIQFADIVFSESPADEATLTKKLKEY